MESLLDRIVEWVARTVDALGGNGTRLRWRWNQRRRDLGESGMRASNVWRSARGRHKMCPSCRTLVPRSNARCPDCGTSLSSVRAPGFTRILANLLPGTRAAASLILLANGFWFVLSSMILLRGQRDVGFTGVLMFPGEFSIRLLELGALWTPAVFEGEWWRLLAPIFLHGGLIHFFFNSYILLQLAPTVEEEYDAHRAWTVYILTGVGGFLGTCLWSTVAGPKLSVGGSGAVIGLMGLLLAYGVRRGGGVGARVKAAIGQYVIYLFLISLLFRGIDHAAHVAGLITGFLLGWFVPYGTYRNRRHAAFWEMLAYALGLVLVLAWIQVVLNRPGAG